MGHLVQMAGLAVQNFVSAAVGIAVVAALVRGFTRRRTDRVGNFWVDLTRVVRAGAAADRVRLRHRAGGRRRDPELPRRPRDHHPGGDQQTLTGGPVASQEAIKELGTNGGGFYNANSAHPFENPNAFTNILEIYLLLVIPFSLPRTFGKMVGDHRQGYAILAVMAPDLGRLGRRDHRSTSCTASAAAPARRAGGMLEGKEQRFGIWASALFAASTTLTSTGAVNSFHDSFSPARRRADHLQHDARRDRAGRYRLRPVRHADPGRHHRLRGRPDGRPHAGVPGQEDRRPRDEVRLPLHPGHPRRRPDRHRHGDGAHGRAGAMLNTGPHGFSEVLYAFTSAANNNGSAFAGLTVNTDWWNTALGLAMLFGRFLPMIFVLALAGSLAAQQPVPVTAGTLPTHRPLFVGPAHRRRSSRRRPHLLPGALAGSARGRSPLMTLAGGAPRAPGGSARKRSCTGSRAACSTRSSWSPRCRTRAGSSTRG